MNMSGRASKSMSELLEILGVVLRRARRASIVGLLLKTNIVFQVQSTQRTTISFFLLFFNSFIYPDMK